MRKFQQWAAAILSVCMVISSAQIRVQAQNLSQDTTKTIWEGEETEGDLLKETKEVQLENEEGKEEKQLESGEGKEEKQLESEEGKEEKQLESEEGKEERLGREKTIQEESQSRQRMEEQDFLAGELNFMMQESNYIQSPGVQNIVASLGSDGLVIEHAQLYYQNQAGQEYITDAAAIVDNMVKFTMEYADNTQTGIYQLVEVRYRADGKEYRAVLAELGMEVTYGVNQDVETEPDDILLDEDILEEVEANVVTMDGEGNPVSENSLGDILEEAKEEGKFEVSPRAASPTASKKVIVLDPGHDSTHAGARGNGCKEEELVLKIAKYCRTELKKYAGVTVYMTRETNSCPYGGSTVGSATCNAARVEFAANKKADVYVSFHLNSSASTSPSASGVGVYYPNGNYRPELGAEGKGLAWEIFQKLSALGLSTWADGILIHNSENNTTYPDGSLADYLAIIRRSKLAGFPAVLIEHAFLSYASDVSGFLNTDAKLKKLGVADAKGIVAYYGLKKRGSKPEIQSIQSRKSNVLQIKWSEVKSAASYQVYRSDPKTGAYSKVADVKDCSLDDKGVKSGVTYNYKVRAVYTDGEKSSFSAIHSGKALTAPKITSISSKSGSSLKITWKKVSGVKTYELVRKDSLNGTYQKIATIDAKAGTVYTDKAVKKHKRYYYKVRARGGEKNGYSSYCTETYGWVVKKTSITSVSSKDSTSLLVQWKKINNAYAYRVKRSTNKSGTYQVVAVIKNGGTSYMDMNLIPEKQYYYKVEVVNRVNGINGSSGYCSAVGGKTVTSTTVSYVRSYGTGSMEVKWKKSPGAYAYNIKRSTKKNGSYKKIAEIRDGNVTQYVDRNVEGGKRYYYVVETVVKNKGVKGYSGNSKAKSAINLQKVQVENIQAGNKGITLAWKKAAGANCYQIMRSAQKSTGFVEVAKIEGGDITSFTDTKVKAGSRYYYRIRAVREGSHTGRGSYGKIAEKRMLAAPA